MLSLDENQLLARGLSFCPTPRNINWTEVRADCHEFSRRMRLLEYFHDYPPRPILTHSVPKAIGPLPYTGTLHLTFFLMLSSMTSLDWNQPLLETIWLHVNGRLAKCSADEMTLSSNRLTRVRALLLWIATGCINECLRQLNDTKFYKLLDNDITTDIQKRILKYTEHMNREKIINEETKRYLIQTDPKPGRFYILPKVHKQETLDALLSLATLTRRNASHNL